jgi:septum formation protein
MLKTLSDNLHTVYTGVCLKTKKLERAFWASTDVYFRKLDDAEIEYYLDKYKPYDKAGSYGIQEWIGFVGIERINGSYFNVMGLPVQKLYDELKKI